MVNAKDKFTKKDRSILIHKFLEAIATSAIQIFLPIIIYKLTNSLSLAVLFSMLKYLVSGVFTLVLKKFLVKNQFLSIMLSIIPLVLVQVIIVFIQMNIVSVIFLSLLSGIYIPLYYFPINIYFSITDEKTSVAGYELGSLLGSVLFILLSGYLLSTNITSSLLVMGIIAVTLFIFSRLVLLKNYKKIKNVSRINSESLLKVNKKLKKDNFFHIFMGISSIAIFDLLPLYLFYSNLSIDGIAYVMASLKILNIGVNYLAQYFMKINKNYINYLIGSLIIFINCILTIFIKDANILYFITSLNVLAFYFLFVASFGHYVKKIKKDNIVSNGLLVRDFYLGSSRAMVAPLFLLFPFSPLMFILGAIGAVGMYFTRIN